MNIKIIPYIAVAAALLSYAGCAKGPDPDDKVLATVSNRQVTLKELKGRIAKLPPYYEEIVDKNKKKYLDEMIMEMMLYEEAIRNRLDRDKEVIDVINEAKKKILIAKFIKDEVEDKVEVPEGDVKEYYEAHKADFKTSEMWRASHILVSTEEEANAARDELAKGVSFEDVAKKYSIDATANRGGDVGFFKKGQVIPEFENVCVKMNVGDMSDIIHTQFGYHIIRLTDKKDAGIETYDKVKHSIVDILKKEKRRELFDNLVLKLKKKYNVKIEEDVFKSLEELGGKESPGSEAK